MSASQICAMPWEGEFAEKTERIMELCLQGDYPAAASRLGELQGSPVEIAALAVNVERQLTACYGTVKAGRWRTALGALAGVNLL